MKPVKRFPLMVVERAGAVIKRPVLLVRAAEVAAEAERRRLSFPTQAEDGALGEAPKYARWEAVSVLTPPRGRGIQPAWEAGQIPTCRLLLPVLRHEAGTLPRAHDGSALVASALSLMPNPYGGTQKLLDATWPEEEIERPMFLGFVNEHAGVFRIAVIQGHSRPFSQTEMRESSLASS